MDFGIRLLPALADGSGLDSQGNTITNDAGLVHNGCEVSLIEDPTATELLDTVVININGTPYDVLLTGGSNGRAKYGVKPLELAFITTWTVDTTKSITVPTTGTGYDGTIQWEELDGTIMSSLSFSDADMSDLTYTLPSAGTYRCIIKGSFPRIYFNDTGDKLHLTTVDNLGYTGMTSLNNAFCGCENMVSCVIGDTNAYLLVTDLFAAWAFCSKMVSPPDMSNFILVTNIFAAWYVNSALIATPDVSNMPLLEDVESAWYSCGEMIGSIDLTNSPLITTLQDAVGNCPLVTEFRFPLSINNLTTASQMLNANTSCPTSNIDEILKRAADSLRANGDEPKNIPIHFGSNKRSVAGTADYEYLVNTGLWTITGGTL